MSLCGPKGLKIIFIQIFIAAKSLQYKRLKEKNVLNIASINNYLNWEICCDYETNFLICYKRYVYIYIYLNISSKRK